VPLNKLRVNVEASANHRKVRPQLSHVSSHKENRLSSLNNNNISSPLKVVLLSILFTRLRHPHIPVNVLTNKWTPERTSQSTFFFYSTITTQPKQVRPRKVFYCYIPRNSFYSLATYFILIYLLLLYCSGVYSQLVQSKLAVNIKI
jgi:hypothetical protein